MRERLPLYIILGIAIIIAGVSILGALQYQKGWGITKKIEAYELKENEVGVTYDLGEVIVNLSHPRDYIKANIVLELMVKPDPKYSSQKTELIKEIKEREPQIRDVINIVVGAHHCDALVTDEGKEEVKKKLVKVINKKIGFMQLAKDKKVGKIKDIYFTDVVVECAATTTKE